jgi:hypothetical protein
VPDHLTDELQVAGLPEDLRSPRSGATHAARAYATVPRGAVFRGTILAPSATDFGGAARDAAGEPMAETRTRRAFATRGGTGRDSGGKVRFPLPIPRLTGRRASCPAVRPSGTSRSRLAWSDARSAVPSPGSHAGAPAAPAPGRPSAAESRWPRNDAARRDAARGSGVTLLPPQTP